MYSIVIWETEEDREMGESFVHDTFNSKEEAVEEAKRVFYSSDAAAVEVEDEGGRMVYHISTDGEEKPER